MLGAKSGKARPKSPRRRPASAPRQGGGGPAEVPVMRPGGARVQQWQPPRDEVRPRQNRAAALRRAHGAARRKAPAPAVKQSEEPGERAQHLLALTGSEVPPVHVALDLANRRVCFALQRRRGSGQHGWTLRWRKSMASRRAG